MSLLGCCHIDEFPARLNDQQRSARTAVGITVLGVAVLARRCTGGSGALGAACAGWFGVSHLVAARARSPDCPELGAIASVLSRREVQVGCVPCRIADRGLGLAG